MADVSVYDDSVAEVTVIVVIVVVVVVDDDDDNDGIVSVMAMG